MRLREVISNTVSYCQEVSGHPDQQAGEAALCRYIEQVFHCPVHQLDDHRAELVMEWLSLERLFLKEGGRGAWWVR